MAKLKVAAICGSLREGSFNRQLMKRAMMFVPEAQASVQEIDLREYDLPIYNADIQNKGFPPSVIELKGLLSESDVLLISSPEYNYSIPGGLKNFIDWLSRGEKNSFGGKVVAIMGASIGNYGTVRGQAHLRLSLSALNVLMLTQPQVMISQAETAFNPDGSIADRKIDERLKSLVEKTIALARTVSEK